MEYTGSLAGGSAGALKRRLKLGGADTVVAGQVVIYDTAEQGTTADPTTTAAADAIGITLEAGTYSTSQSDTEGTAEVVYGPFSIFRAVVAGDTGGTANTALVISENNTASSGGTTLTESDLPSDSMAGGLIYALTGANAGRSRIITTFTSATSLVVTVPFNSAIASGDKFLVFGAAPFSQKLELSGTFIQGNQWFPTATGIDAGIVDIIINDSDVTAPTAWYDFMFRDHVYNPIG